MKEKKLRATIEADHWMEAFRDAVGSQVKCQCLSVSLALEENNIIAG